MEGLRKGDQTLIAEVTGVSFETVKKTVAGDRKNPKVLAAIKLLQANRQAFIQQYQKQTKRDA